MTDLPTLLSASDDVAGDEVGDPQSLALLLRDGSSLGGARPKAHVRGDNGRIAIAKFPSPADGWNVMAWERTALDLAAAAGIEVPGRKLVKVDRRDVLLVDRFDRMEGGVRRGHQSAMTALERTDGDQGSYLEIAEVIEERSRNATVVRQVRDAVSTWREVAARNGLAKAASKAMEPAFVHAASARAAELLDGRPAEPA